MARRDMLKVHVARRRAGAHGKTKKAQRRLDKMKFQKQMKDHHDSD